MKRVILAVLAATVLAAPVGAAEKLKFAVVPKAMNNPFFDIARDGCIKRANELGNVECVYRGPIEHEPATQVQICLLYTSPSPRDGLLSRMPSSA